MTKLSRMAAVPRLRALACALVGGGACLALPAARAFEIDTGNPDVRMRWDNTLKYSAAARVKSQSSTLTGAIDQDDGDRDFSRGIISNRVDLFSEFDVTYHDVGARLSGAAWYDTVYNTSNDHDSPATSNNISVPYNHFTDATRRYHGRDGELMDAFVFGATRIGNTSASVRLGQHALQWGESLFFGYNGIARAQAPLDIIKAVSVPNSLFKEIILPVPQLSGQLQVTPDLSFGAYYQFRWERDRVPAVGSYFSTTDTFGPGAESIRFFRGNPNPFLHGSDMDGKDSGQGGVQMRLRWAETDFGLYYVQFNEKEPQLYFRGSEFLYVYPKAIRSWGASASHTFGIVNLAGEASVRDNMPLNSNGQRDVAGTADDDANALYAVGRTGHAQVSWLINLPPTALAREASIAGEIACNRVFSITKNAAAVNPNTNRDACNFTTVVTPTYRQVASGLDLDVPLGVGFGIKNSRAMGPTFMGDHVGRISVGAKGTYNSVWTSTLNFTHYFGPEGTFLDSRGSVSFKQSLKDRDFISLSISRTL
ncbi:MAG TPA: DUF1302 family protein [Caldimonas sp.]|nr:DUF1302 family protein [Caldimonas sp.]